MAVTIINTNVPTFEKFRALDVKALNNDLQNVELLDNESGNKICSIDNVYDRLESDIVSLFL